MNILKLKGALAEKGETINSLCKALGYVPSTFYRKINNKKIDIDDVNAITKYLDLSENQVKSIFFNDNVAFMHLKEQEQQQPR